MRLAVCISGVNNKNSRIVKFLKEKIPEATYFYHTFSNKTNLIDKELHDSLFTMHYPKWHYHPMEVPNICKHGKFKKYVQQKLSWDKLYFGTVPILQHCDLLRKIPKEYNLIIRCDWNTQIDRQVDLHHWYRKAFEQGPIGFMVRDNRGPNFGSGKLHELPKDENDVNNDWFHFLPSTFIIHHRKHFDVQQVTQLNKNCE